MPPKRQNVSTDNSNSTPTASSALKKRLNDDDSTVGSSIKRIKAAPVMSLEGTPASQRVTRSSTRATRGANVRRTLAEEFKDITAGAWKEAKEQIASESPVEEKFEEPGSKELVPVELFEAALKSPTSDDNIAAADAQLRQEMGWESSPVKGLAKTPSKTPAKTPSKTLVQKTPQSKKGGKGQESTVAEPTSSAKKASTRIRFNSNEPAEQPRSDNSEDKAKKEEWTAEQNDDDEDEEDSDDEAPEDITHASAQAQAKAAAADAARAADKQKADEKRKRQERDARLKEQARQAKKRKFDGAELVGAAAKSAELDDDDEEMADADSRETSESSDAPDLLPESLLARIGDVRLPTPDRDLAPREVDLKLQKRNQHIKFIEKGDRPTKDVRKGPVNVRVLDKQNRLMAPKATKDNSRMLRDFMLQGRNGDGSAKSYVKVERKKTGGGFLKK